jgi:hypothetical protein
MSMMMHSWCCKALLWPRVHPILLDICIAFAPMRLPPYVLLEICDWLPVKYEIIDWNSVIGRSDMNESMMHRVRHIKKIRLIEGVQRSQRNIDEQRAKKSRRENARRASQHEK